MPQARGHRAFFTVFSALSAVLLTAPVQAAAAQASKGAPAAELTLWQLLVNGGWVMVPLGLISILAMASVIYHFLHVSSEKLTPRDFTENLLALLERRELDKAASLCTQQPNLISAVALQGIKKAPKGRAVAEEAILYEGKARIEKLWQSLNYLGDMAVIAPMLGLLGTVLGMIDAFDYQAFSAGSIQPISLAQGLSKAMITTAAGLIIAIPILGFYGYFRGRIGRIAADAERTSSEIAHLLAHPQEFAETRR